MTPSRSVFVQDLTNVMSTIMREDNLSLEAFQLAAQDPSSAVYRELSAVLFKYRQKYPTVVTDTLIEESLFVLTESAPLVKSLTAAPQKTAPLPAPQKAAPLPAPPKAAVPSLAVAPLSSFELPNSVEQYLNSKRYKEEDLDISNPVRYLKEKLRVSPDQASNLQLLEACQAARIAEINDRQDAKSLYRARRFNAEEILSVFRLGRERAAVPSTKVAARAYVEALSEQLKAQLGQYWNSTEFLKNTRLSTAAHYGEAHMRKITGFFDVFFAENEVN